MSEISPERLLLEYCEDAVVLLRQYPPQYDSIPNSFIGGEPYLSPHVNWPTNKEGVPLHFLAQIDCSEIPNANEDFPSTGVLYFFAKIDEETTWSHEENEGNWCVIYSATSYSTPTSPPDTLPNWGGRYCDFERKFGPKTNMTYNTYAKWPLIAKKIKSWPSSMGLEGWWEMDFDHDAQLKTIDEKRTAQLTQFSDICSLVGVQNADFCTTKPFPHAWLVVERICRYLSVGLDEFANFADVVRRTQVIAESRQWIKISEAKGLENSVSTEFQDKFISWINEIQAGEEYSISKFLEIAIKVGMNSAINESGANEKLAAHFTEALFKKRNVMDGYHQMFGYGPNGANYTQPVKSEEILLLHLSSDTLSGFNFCDSDPIVFTIKLEHLRSRDFTKTTAFMAQ